MGKSLMSCFFDSQRQMKSEENDAKISRSPGTMQSAKYPLRGSLAKPQATRHLDRFIRFGTAPG